MSTVGAKQQKLANKHNKTGYEALPCKYMYCPASQEWQWRYVLFTKLSETNNW